MRFALRKSVRSVFCAVTVSMSMGVAAIESAPLDGTAVERWAGFLIVRPLVDGSRLSEFQARTISDSLASQAISNKDTASDEITEAALAEAGVDEVVLRIGFVPRFGCKPLLSVVASGETGVALAASMAGQESVVLTIDDAEQIVPVAVETDVDRTYLWFKLASVAQKEVQSQIDVASRAAVELPNDEYEFSLLGSQDSVEATLGHCLDFEPVPIRRR